MLERTIVRENESADEPATASDISGDPERLDHPTPKPIFVAEVNYWAEKLRVQPTEVRVRVMKNKWSSSTAGGRVSFSSELLWQVPSLRKQVIVEELERLKTQLRKSQEAPAEEPATPPS